MASLAEIRARLAAQENKQSGNTRTQSDNAIYPHWNMAEGTTATLRFAPDGNPNNTFFWAERQIIKLPFAGVKGDANSKRVEVQVPCIEMYGDNCPILAEVRPWYKDESLKEMANSYWKKRSYLFQGFVRQNPIAEDKTPPNPIRRFIISPQIFTVIKSSLMDPELEELPTHYTQGLDFNVKKTSKGGYADYSTSNWARKMTPLTEAEQQAIESFGLYNLADFLPKKPSEAELRIIKEMFEASVDGRPYDAERWGAYYKPYGLEIPGSAQSARQDAAQAARPTQVAVPVNAPVAAPATESKAAPWDAADETPAATAPVKVPAAGAATSDKAQDILAMIRQRQNKVAG